MEGAAAAAAAAWVADWLANGLALPPAAAVGSQKKCILH